MGNLHITIEQFAEAAARQMGELLGDGYTVEPKAVTKNNGVGKTGVMVHGGQSNVAPVIYLDGLYQGYLDGMTLEEACRRLVRSYREDTLQGNVDVSGLRQFGSVKGRLCCRLLNAAKNREMLGQVPHRLFLDLALVAYVPFEAPQMGEGTVTVNRQLLEAWGIGEDTLFGCAMENTLKLGQDIVSMEEVLREIIGLEDPERAAWMLPDAAGSQFYVVSNDKRSFGAVVMLDEGLLRRFSDKIGSRDYYIIPSSVHELLFLPKGLADAEELRRMVREVNGKEVAPEEVLSDNVYYYNRIAGRVEIA